ncbi:MAG TPA: PhnD/SsuA/transferrin family substrate-binding protein [Bryobacteraceae bacterium]|nr:PhnD/SsuA/transferrin family substrate-binding protein [Bryobacteraceae bacterium]
MKIRRMIGHVVRWLAAAALCGATGGRILGVDRSADGLRPTRLYAIVSASTLGNLNRNDLRAAMKAWFDTMARQKGFLLDSKVDFADSVAQMRERLESRSADVLVVGVPDYLELEGTRLVVAAFTHGMGTQGEAHYSYLLLVNSSSGASDIGSLRGKRILTFSRGGWNAGAAWLDVLLNQEKLGRAASFFSSVKPAPTGQACILPVFFGTADACVVDEINFDLAKEMNPQLGRLRVVVRSHPLIESLIVLPTQPHPYQKELFDTLLTLQDDPRGRQLLMVFKIDRLVPVPAKDLDSARELWREFSRLPGGAPRAATSGTAERED